MGETQVTHHQKTGKVSKWSIPGQHTVTLIQVKILVTAELSEACTTMCRSTLKSSRSGQHTVTLIQVKILVTAEFSEACTTMCRSPSKSSKSGQHIQTVTVNRPNEIVTTKMN